MNISLCVVSILIYIVLRTVEVNIIFRGNSSPNVPPVRREPRIIAREAFIVGLAVFIANYLVIAFGFLASGDGIGSLMTNVSSFLKGKDKKTHSDNPPILMGGFPEKKS